MEEAIFLNGVYENVLNEIFEAQRNNTDLICYLQPNSSQTIRLLAKNPPSKEKPIAIYISTTKKLGEISYIADIVGWENKQGIEPERLELLNNHLQKYQDEEIYMTGEDGKDCINLISILSLERLPPLFSVTNLVKVKNNTPLKIRTQSGGWSYVHKLPNWIGINEAVIKERFEQEFEDNVTNSQETNDEIRRKRLATAPKIPEQVQIISRAYRRNPDVVVEVLNRAKGKCERCKSDAPFLRAKDNSPYLEIHHWVPLSEGGEDTVDKAAALCPNCHREVHFGQKNVI